MSTDNKLPYEEAAEVITTTGWSCKKCRRFFGASPEAEGFARSCCAESLPCECGGRTEKHWRICSNCRAKKAESDWANLPEKEWDGTTPVCIDDDYFFDSESLVDFLWDNSINVYEAKIEHCEADYGSTFSMEDFLRDSLPEDCIEDFKEIDKIVNDWIEKHAPYSWRPGGERVSKESLKFIEEELGERGRDESEE